MSDAAASERWHTLPGTNVKVPMPPSDLITALIMVFLFLPVVVILTRLVGSKEPAATKPAAKEE
jgi:hypothetical protein